MTTTRLVLALAAWIWIAGAVATSAQERRPASPAGRSATQVGGVYDPRTGYVGGQWLEVLYGRPIKRGRDIFGPDDYREFLNDGAEIWRAGANVTTRLVTEAPLVFDGTRVEPGEYTVFIDLQPTPWLFVLSRWPAQTTYDVDDHDALWGSYEYTPERDVLRMPMSVETLPQSHDQLSWQFLDAGNDGGTLGLFWDTTLASVSFTLAAR